jgi:16S rRNA (guanine966-N2)-methyltransferase
MEITITGGIFKGRRLVVPRSSTVRPTMGSVREAIFNIIGKKILEANFLDLYAGFGTVGIEALSRGANFVSFVEKNPKYSYVISNNLKRLYCSNFKIYPVSVDSFISDAYSSYDIIFLDPPYILGDLTGIIEKILNKRLLASSGIIIWEASVRDAIEDERFNIVKEKVYGDTKLIFIEGD